MLGDHHQRRNALPSQISQQLVELSGQVLLLGHRVHVAIEAVDDDHAGPVLFHGLAHTRQANSPGESSAGSICWTVDLPGLLLSPAVNPIPSASVRASSVAMLSSKHENCGVVSAVGRSHCVLHGDRRFALNRPAHQQRAGSAIRSAPQQIIQRRDAALDALAGKRLAMLGRHQPRETLDSAALGCVKS